MSDGSAGFRCSVRDAAQLEELALERLPLGLREAGRVATSHRDRYFDTADRSLQRHGAALRLRHRADGRSELTLSSTGGSGGGGMERYVAELDAADLASALAHDSETARRLRALTDPLLLAPIVELEVRRIRRDVRGGLLQRSRLAFIYDDVTVRYGELGRSFHELQVRRTGSGLPTLDHIARDLGERHELRPAIVTKLDRAAAIRARLAADTLSLRLGPGTSLVVAALNGGDVAVIGDGDDRRLPGGPGAGEAACRHALHTLFQSRVGELHRVGTVSTPGGERSIEAWLVRRVRVPGEAPPAAVSWVPSEALARDIAAGHVRDPATVAAWRLIESAGLLAGSAAPQAAPAQLAASAGPAGAADDLLDAPTSELAFVERVMALAEDSRVPVVERLRYVAIVSSNLDEFYMGTAGALRRSARAGDAAGIARVSAAVGELLRRQRAALEVCLSILRAAGIAVRSWASLSEDERAGMHRYFEREIFPQLTPRAITASPGHPFPIIPALTLGLAVELAGDDRPAHYAYLRLPADLPRFVPVGDAAQLVAVEELVRSELARLYPDRRVASSAVFRITRTSDLEVDERGAGNLLQAMEEDVAQRRTNPVVRVEIETGVRPAVLETLVRELRFERGADAAQGAGPEVQRVEGLLALSDVRELADSAAAAGLEAFPRFTPRNPLPADVSIWDRIRSADQLVHHPYDDFGTTVVRLIADAAADPEVVAIRMTLYRAGDHSPLVEALQLAARSGKDVSVFVELKARFDEARNVLWVRRLEAAGVHVVYGLVGLKNHAKVALVARREDGGIRRYVHIGTGNYNAGTARVYTDLGLFTADLAIGEDVSDFFNQLTGTSGPPAAPFQRLLVAPVWLLPELVSRIDREAAHVRAGRGGRIRMKCNGLADPEIIRTLYRASEAGVEIDLVVRGICTLRPGVPGLSDRIRVTSVLGRFLEHPRIYAFDNGGAPEYLIGSADLRPRNLRRRIEVLVPVADERCRRYLDALLEHELRDPTAWTLGPDGRYIMPAAATGDVRSTQQALLDGRIP